MSKMIQVGFRLPEELVGRLDLLVEEGLAELPGHTLTRADVVRRLLLEGVDRRERAASDARLKRKRG